MQAPGLQVERGLARPSSLAASIAVEVDHDAELVCQGAERLELVAAMGTDTLAQPSPPQALDLLAPLLSDDVAVDNGLLLSLVR